MKISRLLLALFFPAAASLLGNDELKERLQPALEAITPDGLLAHIKVLASDEFEGRAPGSKGEDLSIKYITDQFKKIGLKPGNPDGTYTQEVPLAGIKSEPRMSFVVGDKTMDLKYPDDFVASSARLQPEIKIEKSDLVFVGYGVVAPEYGWDDYKNVDVKGKTLLMLIGDPPVPDPKDPSKLDDKMFKGKAMTYYGRWTYKYEIAAQKGAAAAIMGATYSDLYAAIGIHSGLAYGAATDMPSAFAAMRQSGGAGRQTVAGGPMVPTIIFHGDRDSTVHPDNGAQAVEQAIGATRTQKNVHRGQIPGGHGYTRTIHADGEREILEHWNIHGAGHAWSGGSPAGSYTDSEGPDATKEMLRFFLEKPRPPHPH